MAGVAAGELASVRTGRVLFWSLAAVVFILDRVSKSLVAANIPIGEEVPAIDHLVWMAHTQNSCAAFGQGCSLAVLFIPLYAAVAVGVVVYQFRTSLTAVAAALLGLILGGVAGNGYDRVVHGGAVTDFIALHWWPVFNVADSAISIAVVLLLAGYVIRNRD